MTRLALKQSNITIIDMGNRKTSIILFFSILFMCSCNSSCKYDMDGSGVIPLEEFSIKNKSLDSLAINVLSQFKVDTCKDVVVLDLMWVDNEKSYLFSFQRKDDLMEKHISWQNRRIVGYTTVGDYLTIILSNIDHHVEFLDVFATDLELGNNTRQFAFMHIPKCRYRWNSYDEKQLPWQEKVSMYEPTFIVCKPKGWNEYELSYTK